MFSLISALQTIDHAIVTQRMERMTIADIPIENKDHHSDLPSRNVCSHHFSLTIQSTKRCT